MLHKSKTLWRGIRRHGAGFQAEVRVTGHPRSVMQFPLDTDPVTMQKWRKDEKARLQLTAPRATKGTFAADAKRYLEIVKAMPSFKMRKRDILLWVAIFGVRSRASITRGEIRQWRDEWHARGPKRVYRKHTDKYGGEWVDIEAPLAPSTVNHRLRALANLWTELDGRHAPNPAREVEDLDEGDGEAYGLPYDVIEAVIAEMPDRGRPEKGKERSTVSLTKLRARVIAYTGLPHIDIGRLTADKVNLEEGWVSTGKRKKGKGVSTGRRPLTPQGVDALRALIAAGGLGAKFSASSMRHSIKRACVRLAAKVKDEPGGAELAAVLLKIRPYDFRHSYVSEVLEKSGDFHATQLLSGHADPRTTLRYGKKAINPVLTAALAKVTKAGGFGGEAKASEIRASQNDDSGQKA
jgi:integrase